MANTVLPTPSSPPNIPPGAVDREPGNVTPGASSGYLPAAPDPYILHTSPDQTTASAISPATGNSIIPDLPAKAYITVGDNSLYISNTASFLNFTGDGVEVTGAGPNVVVNIPGYSAGNVKAAGGTTQVQYNLAGNLAGSAYFTFDQSYGNINLFNALNAGNVKLSGDLVANGMANIGGNVVTQGVFIGNAAGLTNVPQTYGDSNVNSFLQLYAGNIGAMSVGATGAITTSANVTGSYFVGNGSLLTGVVSSRGAYIADAASNVTVNGDNSVTMGISGTTLFTLNNTGTYTIGLYSATGNITGGNVNTGNLSLTGRVVSPISSTGNITGANLISSQGVYATGVVSAVGNVNTNNSLNVTRDISATGNIVSGIFMRTINLSVSGNVIGTGGLNVTYDVTANNINSVSGITTGGGVSAVGDIIGGNVYFGGAGTPTITSATSLIMSAPVTVQVTGGGTFRLPSLDQTAIDALLAVNGDMVYNTTLNKFQGYENGAWGNLIA